MQANGRFTMGTPWPDEIQTVPIETEQDLIGRLDDLVRRGAGFERALFQTHGNPGGIWLGNDFVNDHELTTSFSGGRYCSLLPRSNTRIYFDGCNIAEDPDGCAFL